MGFATPHYFTHLGTKVTQTKRGRVMSVSGDFASRQALPSDPQGSFSLTLSGLVVGSVIHVESTSGVSLSTRMAAAETEVLSLSAYAPGSPLNNLRIKVRKGSSAPFYQPWETLTTAIVGPQSIYVSQIPDE